MSEVVSGTLGPVALAELRQIAALRERWREQGEAIDRKEAMILALAAEAQGCDANGSTRYEYDLDAATWRAIIPSSVEVSTT
jgi:hypothetical protein